VEEILQVIEIIAFQRYRSDMQEKALLSYFARGEYNYHQKYLFSASFRRDGSSVFGANNKWGTFPSLALGWAFSEESFVKQHIGWFDLGKLRASWGRSGMNFSQNYLALGIMKAGEPYQGNGVLTPEFHRGLYNDELSWEETDQYDFGLDIDLFHSRFSFTADYYYRYTDKMLMHMPLPGTHNGYREQWRNAAAVSNEGIELLASFKILQRQNIYWKVSVNGARNWNRFEKSYDDRDVSNTWIIGKPLAGMYALRTEGFIQSQSDLPIFFSPTGRSNFLSAAGYPLAPYREGDYRFVDFNGDGLIAPYNDAVYFASALPTISGGILQEVRWRNFDCNLLFSFQLGRHIVNQMPLLSLATTEAEISKPFLLNIDKTVFWSDPGDRDADYPRIQYDNFNWTYFNLIDRYVERVNWLKMKTFTLGYELPVSLSKRFGWSGLRIFYSGENLFTFSSYSGLDPETVPIDTGMDDGKSYPLARKMTLGLTLKF
jgi:TonB-linked SusC/RagA family outer membrane protein